MEEKKKDENVSGGFSSRTTRAIGSPASLLLHTVLFAGALSLYFTDYDFDSVLLILTTLVSLEAIYLAIFIQMTVNRESERLSDVSHDIEEIQEDVEDITEEVKELGDDVEDISEEMEKEEREEEKEKATSTAHLEKIENTLQGLLKEIEGMRRGG